MRRLFVFLMFFCFVSIYAQNNKQWQGYFSYNNIKDVVIGNEKIFAASDNCYFIKDLKTNEVKKITSIEGLSGDDITKIHYSSKWKKIILGHSNGLVVIVDEIDGNVFSLVGIRDKSTISNDKKRINHFEEFDDKVYISTNFGITVLDLKTAQFGDTFIIGPNGADIEVFQTAIFDNFIYAITNSNGVLKASISNPFLVDYNQWSMVQAGNWLMIETTLNKICLVNLSGGVFELTLNNTLIPLLNLPQMAKDIKFNKETLSVMTAGYVYLFDGNLSQTQIISNAAVTNLQFTSGIVNQNVVYVGTSTGGLIQMSLTNPQTITNLSPQGAFRNRVFGLKNYSKGFWCVYGDYTINFNPYPLDSYSVSKYDSEGKVWKDIKYDDLFAAKSISSVYIDKENENNVYLSSYYSGLLKLKNDLPEKIYNASNSSMVSIANQPNDDIRVGNVSLDKSNGLWLTTSITSQPLHNFKKDGQWVKFSVPCFTSSDNSYKAVIVDRNDTKWILTNLDGLVAFNEKSNKCIALTDDSDKGNLPSRRIYAAAIDKSNKLWIGTNKGLRVLPTVDSFLTQNQLKANQIIILEDGVAQELLYLQHVSDIVVDGANNKWIGTAGAGVYYVSDDGQKTIYHFTKENSPLPNDNIIDIDINDLTGEVFFATDSGLVSFMGNATTGADDLKNVYAFPNPVRPDFVGEVSITGLMDKCNVKITDIEGSLVFEAISEGGTVLWDTRVFGKKKVASGVYLVHISSNDGLETEVKKIMIIR